LLNLALKKLKYNLYLNKKSYLTVVAVACGTLDYASSAATFAAALHNTMGKISSKIIVFVITVITYE
jgi:hypothetical protein